MYYTRLQVICDSEYSEILMAEIAETGFDTFMENEKGFEAYAEQDKYDKQKLYEVKDKKRAAELLVRAGENGAPPWVFALAGRLYSDSGEFELAQQLLQEMKDTNQDPTIIKRLEDKIESMKKTPK